MTLVDLVLFFLVWSVEGCLQIISYRIMLEFLKYLLALLSLLLSSWMENNFAIPELCIFAPELPELWFSTLTAQRHPLRALKNAAAWVSSLTILVSLSCDVAWVSGLKTKPKQ